MMMLEKMLATSMGDREWLELVAVFAPFALLSLGVLAVQLEVELG
jgi:hypothetical protein